MGELCGGRVVLTGATRFSVALLPSALESSDQQASVDQQEPGDAVVQGKNNQTQGNHPKSDYGQKTEYSKADKQDPDNLAKPRRKPAQFLDEAIAEMIFHALVFSEDSINASAEF